MEARNVTRRGRIIKKPENFNDYVLSQEFIDIRYSRVKGDVIQGGGRGCDMLSTMYFGVIS